MSESMGGTDDLIMASLSVQDLRRRLYAKAKSEFGGKRWSTELLYREMGLYNDCHIQYAGSVPKALPVR